MKALLFIALFQAQQAERWEELIELDLHRQVLEEARTSMGVDDVEAEHLALAARAAASAGELELAERWLERGEGPAIELERARLLLHQDKLEQALALTLQAGEPPRPKHPERADALLPKPLELAHDHERLARLRKHRCVLLAG